MNMSLCCLRTKDYEKAVKLCEECLNIDPDNIKALLRKGKGLQLSLHVNILVKSWKMQWNALKEFCNWKKIIL